MKPAIRRFDNIVTESVTKIFGARVWYIFRYLTHVGDPRTVTVIAATLWLLGVIQGDIGLAIAAIIIPVTIIVGFLLKLGFERARPLTEYARTMTPQTFSFPSGHSSGSTVCYIVAGWLILHSILPGGTIVALACFVLPVVVGVSRIYLGAHFPSDVVAGWLLGVIGASIAISVMMLV